MRQKDWLMVFPVAIALVMDGCGSGSSPAPPQPQEFQNHTTSSEATLLALWKAAQDSLAKNTITLNQALVATQNAPPITHPPDPRAESVNPDGQVVYGEPDAPGYEGQGIIDCSAVRPDVPLCHGYITVYGAVFVPNSAISNAEYEFENAILMRLGYDVRQR